MSERIPAATASHVNAPLLLERYQPDELIGRGGSAAVYRSRDVLLDRDVAVKVFRSGTEAQLARAREELRMLAKLSHHGIVTVLDAGIDYSAPNDPRPLLVMELIRGEPLRRLIDDGAVPELMVGGVAFEIAEALEYVHRRGVIHRDISPSNILLADYDSIRSRPRARLTDFGIAVTSVETVPMAALREGTPRYRSPEQQLGQNVTSASDIFSLGRVLLACFNGGLPQAGVSGASGPEIADVDPGIPKSVPRVWRRLLERMMAIDPSERPTAAEVMTEVRQILRSRRL